MAGKIKSIGESIKFSICLDLGFVIGLTTTLG
jgi:hypothetical protein